MNHVTLDSLKTLAVKWLGLHPAYRKYAVALVGVIAQIANLGLVSGAAQRDLVIALAVATALGVRAAVNTDAPAPATPITPSNAPADAGMSAIELCVIVLTGLVILYLLGAVR